MLLIYRYLINILYPLIILIVYLRTKFNKEDKIRYKEKLFTSSFNIKKIKKKLIWFHAASLGELNSVIPLIKKINKKKKFQILITTITLSSAKLASKELIKEKNIIHRFFPIDKTKLVKEFLNKWSPNLVIFIDSEIWPNFLLEIKKKKIPLVLLNGRITKKTFLRWSKIPKTANKVFQSFDLCLPSSKISKNYLKKLNVKKIKYYGNLKLTSNENSKIYNFKNKKFLKQNNFWSAVSIHEEEILFCLKVHINIKKVIKNIVTIIIPRHIGKVKKIKSVCEKLSLNCQILSDGDIIKSNKEVIIINAYGVMASYLKVCKSVFIGKSMQKKLEKVGGQNPIEAAKLGCKVYHGPYVNNFKEIYELFNKLNIAKKILSENDLSNKLISDLRKSNNVNNNKINIINNIGKKILKSTYDELNKIDTK